jgi:CRP/FNR family cyclic AMP-dependent transcriptional regulator
MKSNAMPPFDLKVFLTKADGGRTISKYRTNQIVFSQGDPADSVFYIHDGKVKVSIASEQGTEAVIAVLGRNEFCGEGCLTGQPRRVATATAITECIVMRLDKATIIRVLHDEPAFSEMFVSHLLARTIRVEADLVDQLFNSSEKRLARALLLLANFGKEGRPETIIAKVSQETLAEMIGTTRARVNYFMNKFRQLGFIDYNRTGNMEVHSSLLNVVLHDQPHIRTQMRDDGTDPVVPQVLAGCFCIEISDVRARIRFGSNPRDAKSTPSGLGSLAQCSVTEKYSARRA